MAEVKLGAGDLHWRLQFQKRGEVDDGHGNTVPGGEFLPQFTVWAHMRPLRGGESVMASRLQGRQPYIITVRHSTQTQQANENWQIVDARRPDRVFSISAPPTDPDGKRRWLEFLAVENGTS